MSIYDSLGITNNQFEDIRRKERKVEETTNNKNDELINELEYKVNRIRLDRERLLSTVQQEQ